MTRLYLIRHGHTVWHKDGRVAGSSDIELSDDGKAAVRRLAMHGSALASITHRSCSPMQRTRQTNALIDAQLATQHEPLSADNSCQYDERLVELHFGRWEGMTWQAVHEQDGVHMKRWGEDWVNQAPPQGESFASLSARCQAWLTEHLSALPDESSSLVVTHGGCIRALLCLCLNWPLQRAMSFQIDPASVTQLDRTSSNTPWVVRQLNSQRF